MLLKILNKIKTPEVILAPLLCAVLAGFFFLETAPHRILLYLAILLGLFSIHKNNAWDIFKNKDLLWRLTIAFLGFTALSLLWSQGMDIERIWQKLKPVLFITIAMAIAIHLFRQNERNWAVALEVFISAAIISGICLLLIKYEDIIMAYTIEDPEFIWRLEGFGRVNNENIAGLLYAAAALIALSIKGDFIKRYANKKIRILIFIFLSFIVFLTLSRGAILSFIAVSAMMVFVHATKSVQTSNIKKIIALAILGGIGGVIFLSVALPDVTTYMIERGSTGRLQIWQIAWNNALQSPIYGQGIGTKYTYEVYDKMPIVVGHAHNLYLSVFLQTGAIGFILFLSIIILAMRRAYTEARQNCPAALIMLSFGLVFGLVDLGGYYTNLGATWIVFWLPLAFIIHKRSQKNT